MTWFIVLIVWLIGILITYGFVTRKWDDKKKSEQIYYAIIWPLTLILYLIHLVNKN